MNFWRFAQHEFLYFDDVSAKIVGVHNKWGSKILEKLIIGGRGPNKFQFDKLDDFQVSDPKIIINGGSEYTLFYKQCFFFDPGSYVA